MAVDGHFHVGVGDVAVVLLLFATLLVTKLSKCTVWSIVYFMHFDGAHAPTNRSIDRKLGSIAPTELWCRCRP